MPTEKIGADIRLSRPASGRGADGESVPRGGYKYARVAMPISMRNGTVFASGEGITQRGAHQSRVATGGNHAAASHEARRDL